MASGAGLLSGKTVGLDFEIPDLAHQGIKSRRVGTNESRNSHGVAIRLQAGKLVVVGNETQPALKASIVLGATGMEEYPPVPDDIVQEAAVEERCPADIALSWGCQVGPMPASLSGQSWSRRRWHSTWMSVAFSQNMCAGERTVTVAEG